MTLSPTAHATIDLACTLQQIPGPTFSEGQRAVALAEQLAKDGLSPTIDSAGNVLAWLPGQDPALPPLVVTAHLDSVFPLDTPLDLDRGGEHITGPGIGDNALGLAALLGLVWRLREARQAPAGPLLLAATTGEEGLGDLRGMRALVDALLHQGKRPGFIVLEGLGLGEIYHRGLGVRRYRVTCRTPGGHSWIDYGHPSAVHELARLAAQLAGISVPNRPRSSLNIGVFNGGTSVNTIAAEAQMEIDVRSEQVGMLEQIARRVESLAAAAHRSPVSIQWEVIGNRPAGEIPASHPLVRLAETTLRRLGLSPHTGIGSTDANIPLSRGLPAICIGLTRGGGAHTLQEYLVPQPVETGLEQLVQLVAGYWDSLR